MNNFVIRHLGLCPYEDSLQNMQEFTRNRTESNLDELWIVEHPAVFTLGQAGDPKHILTPGNIPIIQSDRGGQVTYHGPGQLVVYTLIDIQRKNLTIRGLVSILETALINLLKDFNIEATSKCDAPGVYVENAKIASLGLRIRKGCSYHGLSLNVAMDLAPFSFINPCGYSSLKVVQTRDLGGPTTLKEAATYLIKHLETCLTPTPLKETL